ncbi:L,D-transpeptidase [Nocardioides sp.]|uniref:L,D-transpeptidase n=1 Tax=Nocardioides sp. TaxID=35761 RepID=UPI0039E45F36
MSASPRHRAARRVRPRPGRIAALAAALAVVVVAVAGAAVGALRSSEDPASQAADGLAQDAVSASLRAPLADSSVDAGESTAPPATAEAAPVAEESASQEPAAPDPKALPEGTGSGKRVVFSEEAQRVWLVAASGEVERTYLVSGSVTDNLDPGTYSVYSTSRWAVGVDDSGVMEYFVRFTKGPTGAAIGFHTIPTKDGVPLQTKKQLGTPQSHGCIRQRTPDAIALWDFAPTGTKVVVI